MGSCGGGSGVVGFVELVFFCCMRRWPMLVAMGLMRCFVTRWSVSPGHEWK